MRIQTRTAMLCALVAGWSLGCAGARRALAEDHDPESDGGGKSAPLETRAPDADHEPFFSSPFKGDFDYSGAFDHDPLGSGESLQLTAWGVKTFGKAAHPAWDWPMPVGTPLYSVADEGRVTNIWKDKRMNCNDGRKKVPGNGVWITYTAPGGTDVYTVGYLHLSEVLVELGDVVDRGQLIGKSGNTGCSTGPHLHFSVQRRARGQTPSYFMDPYGWSGKGKDPMDTKYNRPNPYLWREGEAPRLFRDKGRPEKVSQVKISRVESATRDRDPDYEFVEIQLLKGPKKGADIGGAMLRNNAGDRFVFPEGTVLMPGKSLRVVSGKKGKVKKAGEVIAWGRKSTFLDPAGDCVVLIDPEGEERASFSFGQKQDDLCNPAKRRW